MISHDNKKGHAINSEQPQFDELPEKEGKTQELTGKVLALFSTSFEACDKAVAFVEQLRAKYPNYPGYRLYHVLAGSTPTLERPCSQFDFPGEDSVELFIRKLEEEFGKKE